MRNGYSIIQITNATVCNFRKLTTWDINSYSVTCDKQRKFSMVKYGVNGSDHNTTWRCQMYSLDYAILGPSSNVTVLIHDSSPILSPNSPLYIRNGGSLALTCEIDQDVAVVTWIRNGYSSIQITNTTMCNFRKLALLDMYNYSMTCDQQRKFTIVKHGVNGTDHNTTWRCQMYSLNYTDLGSSSDVTVLLHGLPSVKSLISPIEVLEGNSLEVVCQSDGIPSPQLTWSPQGEDKLNQSRLYFHSVTRNQNGTYTCAANNTMTFINGTVISGSDYQIMFLNVLCKLTLPFTNV
ncbi:hypothetical protein CHS0354_039085 [Potamilus streckersoni]|uniref:Ig-like domain-containing protein n=1 Tax=Potamilus streckersoni TaxID=2493646 RepID=A0AAE0W4U0_9BIVA|nr:hypothetical protein CHS0354_039085 [Potamilus streckersoni]